MKKRVSFDWGFFVFMVFLGGLLYLSGAAFGSAMQACNSFSCEPPTLISSPSFALTIPLLFLLGLTFYCFECRGG